MNQVELLADNDIVIKLSRMDAYSDALGALKLVPSQVGSLAVMLRYMGKASETNRLKLVKDRPTADRLARILHSITEIEPTLAEKQLAAKLMKIALTNGLDIEEGELALICVALLRNQPDVATGDKRALRSLPGLAKQESTVKAMLGRLICFEQLFKLICQKFGLPRVRDAVTLDRDADATITRAYDFCGSGNVSRFIALLDAVIKEHVDDPAPGWLKPM